MKLRLLFNTLGIKELNVVCDDERDFICNSPEKMSYHESIIESRLRVFKDESKTNNNVKTALEFLPIRAAR
jgi:hypothetical protein